MDCAKLRADTEKLRELRDAFDSKYRNLESISTETAKNFRDSYEQINLVENEILENYLQDFNEENRDLFEYKYGEIIHNFGEPVFAFLELDNGDIFVSHGDRQYGSFMVPQLGILRKQEDGNYEFVEDLDCSLNGFRHGGINCMEQFDSGDIVFGGDLFGCLHMDDSGGYRIFGDLIECSDDCMTKMPNGDIVTMRNNKPVVLYENGAGDICPDYIRGFERNSGEGFSSVLAVSDTEFLIGGDYLSLIYMESDGFYYQGDVFGGTDKYVNSLIALDDGGVLVVGGDSFTERSDVRILRRSPRGGFELSESIFESDRGCAESAVQLPNGDIAIALNSDENDIHSLEILSKKKDGSYEHVKTLEGYSAYKLRDGRVLCDAGFGELCFLEHDEEFDLEGLKKNLDRIAAKKH